MIKKAVTFFDSDPIDLMFVDADHNFLPTITNIGVYASLLRPRMIVVDDIVLNRSMKSMWDLIRVFQPWDVINCADVVPQIRPAVAALDS